MLTCRVERCWCAELLFVELQFFDSNFVTQADNRAVTRVRTTGHVKVKLNVITRGKLSARTRNVLIAGLRWDACSFVSLHFEQG